MKLNDYNPYDILDNPQCISYIVELDLVEFLEKKESIFRETKPVDENIVPMLAKHFTHFTDLSVPLGYVLDLHLKCDFKEFIKEQICRLDVNPKRLIEECNLAFLIFSVLAFEIERARKMRNSSSDGLRILWKGIKKLSPFKAVQEYFIEEIRYPISLTRWVCISIIVLILNYLHRHNETVSTDIKQLIDELLISYGEELVLWDVLDKKMISFFKYSPYKSVYSYYKFYYHANSAFSDIPSPNNVLNSIHDLYVKNSYLQVIEKIEAYREA